MIIIGLTGSIGMGKSTTANMFRAEGVCIHDSDATVHNLYRGPAVPAIAAQFPTAVIDGAVDRAKLAAELLQSPDRFKSLERIVHPLVKIERDKFIQESRRRQQQIVVLDIPLLFEIGVEHEVDLIVVCTAAEHIQEARVMARPGMTREKFNTILARQMSDSTKRRLAHALIDTGVSLDDARRQVKALLRSLASG